MKMIYEPSTEFEKFAAKSIYDNKYDFEQLRLGNQKLAFVKLLKEYTGGGLKECKDVADLYWEGNFKISYLKEERKAKLEKLAKGPLVEELLIKFKNTKEEDLFSYLMKLSVDELLSIDEIFDKHTN